MSKKCSSKYTYSEMKFVEIIAWNFGQPKETDQPRLQTYIALPTDIKLTDSLNKFKIDLKTHLFRIAFK